jgi:uncharacterized membrane protein
VPQEIADLLAPEHKREGVHLISQFIRTQYSGPIPPAREMVAYEQALPGSANRIMSMAEKEQNHRHGLEVKEANREFSIKRWGQILAMFALLVLVGLVIFFVVEGHAREGAVLGGGVIVLVVASFLGPGVVRHLSRRRSGEADDDDGE